MTPLDSAWRVRIRLVGALLLLVAAPAFMESMNTTAQQNQVRGWPSIAAETKPWTRWWWHGSAVERPSLSAQLQALAAAGIGGVEITPIYGVRGAEDRFIPYLSPRWMTMLDHTLREAARLKLGVDMATGTGWPFGGPWVGDDTAPRSLVHKTWTLTGGERLTEPVTLRQTPLVRAIGNQIHIVNEGAPGDPPRGATPQAPVIRPEARAIQIGDLVEPVLANRNLQALALEQVKYPRDLPLTLLMAYSDAGEALDLTSRVQADGRLDWMAPSGRWSLYAIFAGWHGKLVERAAPGGEGNVIDHFSTDAIRKYLLPFDHAFKGRSLVGLRAFFNDSYEVDDATGEADWTPRLLEEFEKRRGYDLRQRLPQLLGKGTDDVSARVLADYRETISDLLLDTFTTEWASWARRHGRQVRNQAHGSPASILDLYAASDMPETEGAEIQRFKWATSAAHVAGRRLVSAEAATWLGEHFRVRLAEVKAAVDLFFVAGVNHVVYHGTAYSPLGDGWPGWQFYASVGFNPQNAWWDDFAALNAYVARVQSFLQSGRPDTDVVVYYPFYESLTVRGPSLLSHFGGAAPPSRGTIFEKAAETLQAAGFTYDFVSDRQLRRMRTENGRVTTEGGTSYQVVVLPSSRYVPLETVLQILELARAGATIVSLVSWPSDVSGLADLDARRARFKAAVDAVSFGPADGEGIREAAIGRGRILQGSDLGRLLARAGVRREPMVDRGLQFARRVDALGRVYFVSNPRDRAIDEWVPLDSRAAAVMAFDPMSGRHGGLTVRTSGDVREVYLQIPAGGSLIVAESPATARASFDAYRTAGEPIVVPGPWTVRFLKGGPLLPPRRVVDRLVSWTTFERDAEVFSGTAAYTTTFAQPTVRSEQWQLDLGHVAETARVRLNGQNLAALIGPPYQVLLDGSQLRATNTLEVSVTNLSANRIRDLDVRGVPWKKFYNVNFPARLPENRGPDGLFSAARWGPLESGLLGPVTLTPLVVVR
jgi:alpha-L-rhamnosidase